MKKGINIWSFTSGTLLDKFKLAADAGFDGMSQSYVKLDGVLIANQLRLI